MRLSFRQERVLAVVAHPDDAELLCAGTLARARADGAAIALCVLCRGDKGQPDPPIENLAGVRHRELLEAAELLDATLFESGFGDGELFDSYEARRQVMQTYRDFQATLVLAHWPNDYHPDHRAAAALAEAASWLCASAGHRTASRPLAAPPALWWMDAVNMADFVPGVFIDVSPYVPLKQKMLACHRSQLQRGSRADFSPLEEVMLRQCAMRGAQCGVAAAEAFRTHMAWKRARAW